MTNKLMTGNMLIQKNWGQPTRYVPIDALMQTGADRGGSSGTISATEFRSSFAPFEVFALESISGFATRPIRRPGSGSVLRWRQSGGSLVWPGCAALVR